MTKIGQETIDVLKSSMGQLALEAFCGADHFVIEKPAN